MKHTLLLAFAILLSITVKSQWTSDTTQNTTVRDSAGSTSQFIATRSDGKTFVSWFEYDAGGVFDLRMQLLDKDGYKLWAAGGIVVDSFIQSTATFRYDMKVDNDNNAIVTSQDLRTGNMNAVIYKVDVNGNLPWGSTGIVLIDSMATEGYSSGIGITGNNDIVVAWNADSANIKKWVACQRISPSGVVQWNTPYRIIDSTGTLRYSRAKLFPAGSDDVQILYVEEAGSFPYVNTMYTQRVDINGGNHFPTSIQVSTKTIPFFFFPEPVPDDNGGFYVAFNTSNPSVPSLNDVYVQYVDYNGALWSMTGAEAANSTTEHKTVTSYCYVSNTSEFWIAMQVQDGPQANSGMSVQKFDGSGSALLGVNGLELIPVDPVYYLPYSISDANDGMILSCIYGGFGNERILAMKIDYTGVSMWPGLNISICAVHSNKDDLMAGLYKNNQLVFVWQDDRNNSGIFAQNISGAGLPGIVNNISELNSTNAIIYPNPSGSANIIFQDLSEKDLTVFNSSGSKIKSDRVEAGIDKYFLENNLSPGIYFISVKSNKNSEVIRWIKTE